MHVRATDAEWAHNTPPPARPTLGTRYRARWTSTTHLARCPVPASQHVCPRPGRSQPLGPRPPHWWRSPRRCGCEVAPDTHDQWWWNAQTRRKARQPTGKHKTSGHALPPAWLHAPHASQVRAFICTICVSEVDACVAGEAPHTHHTPPVRFTASPPWQCVAPRTLSRRADTRCFTRCPHTGPFSRRWVALAARWATTRDMGSSASRGASLGWAPGPDAAWGDIRSWDAWRSSGGWEGACE